jgi:hypothetical protein
MVTKGVSIALACAMLLVSSGGSRAGEYRPGEFFSLDLPSAVLSPKPFGPLTEFRPSLSAVAVDRTSEGVKASTEASTEVSTEPNAPSNPVVSKAVTSKPVASNTEPRITIHKTRVVHLLVEKPHGAARTRVARRHTNPLDAQALDTRVQVWPCRSGGICDWKR